VQVVARRFGALHVVQVGTGDAGDLRQIARDVFGHGRLLFGGGSDLAVHVADRFHGQGDALEHGTGLGDLPTLSSLRD
jgi:hypothetical protein